MAQDLWATPAPENAAPQSSGREWARLTRVRSAFLAPGWPLTALLVGFPLWWAAGLSNFAAMILSVPMVLFLLRRRPIRLPRGFSLWLLFLLWTVAGLAVLGVDPPGTVAGSGLGRVFGWGMREASFLAATVVLLYLGNLTEEEYPQRKVIRLLGWLFVWTVLGGVLGLLAPDFEFTSPMELILPASISGDIYGQALFHPAAAQIQEVLASADPTPRPAAPYGYTNAWSYHLTVLGIWFAAGWLVGRRTEMKLLSFTVLSIAAVVLVYSLNRGAWVGVGVGLAIVAWRLLRFGKFAPIVAMAGVLMVAMVLFVSSPLFGLAQERLDTGHSDDIRGFTTERALAYSATSPIVGFGSTRQTLGSPASIAVGRSDECPQCGNVSIGINGYVFMLLMTTGWVGAALFYSFLGVRIWHARGDPSPQTTAAIAVVAMTAYYGLTYDISRWFLVLFITMGVMWRQERALVRQPGGHGFGS